MSGHLAWSSQFTFGMRNKIQIKGSNVDLKSRCGEGLDL